MSGVAARVPRSPRRQAVYDPKARTYLIPLTRGRYAIVDLEDVEWLSQWDWHLHSDGYATRMDVSASGKRVQIRMHRALAEHWGWRIAKFDIDHTNNNGLDNRRGNLRVATRSQNGRNRGAQRNNTSGAKGVTWSKSAGKWEAKIWLNKKRHWLGLFETKEEAAEAYRAAAAKLHGRFAWEPGTEH